MNETRMKRLPVLPNHDDNIGNDERPVALGRFPSWLHRRLPKGTGLKKTEGIVAEHRLHTVCEEANCPNQLECWARKTATFLIMGKECTRNCGFCSIDFSKSPRPLDEDEPQRAAESVKALGLQHVVITMVARDDLDDGGSSHLVKVIAEIRRINPGVNVEVLTSDFQGSHAAWQTVLEAQPEIFNHNIETVRALTPRVRHKATYDRTLELLSYVNSHRLTPKTKIKSGLMVGLGETEEQVYETLRDLKDAGCEIVTIGQYLQSDHKKLLVKAFIPPEQFKTYERYGYDLGFAFMYCGPFVRSSYHADAVYGESIHD